MAEIHNPHDYGKFLRYLRHEVYQETIREFAVRCGISHGYLGRLELGGVPAPKRSTVISIAGQLEMDPNDFLTIAGYTPEGEVEERTTRAKATLMKLQRLPEEHQELVLDFINYLVSKYD